MTYSHGGGRTPKLPINNQVFYNITEHPGCAAQPKFQAEVKFERMEYAWNERKPKMGDGVREKISKMRLVTFREEVKVRLVLHRNDYTNREKQNSWFTRGDCERMTEETIKTIKLFKLGFFSIEDVRGLEEWLKRERQSEKPQKQAIRAVLNEQYSQCLKAEKSKNVIYLIYDDVKIREAYRKHTVEAVLEAYSMGKKDEADAGSEVNTYQTEGSSSTSTRATAKPKASSMVKRNSSTKKHRVNPPKIIFVSPE